VARRGIAASKRARGVTSRAPRRSLPRQVGRWIVAAAAFAFMYASVLHLTLPDVRPLATQPPATTAFIELRLREARAAGRPARRLQRWVPYSRIGNTLKRAVLIAEDSAFFDHEGIDYEQLRLSIEASLENFELSRSRGASTITQQLAKNLYLSPSRNPLRKFRELLITRLLEGALPKRRILELYLNEIEWGDGIYGAEAAARTYFGVPAAALSAEQAALLAGAIINPRLYSPASPPRRLLARQRLILRRMQAGTPAPAPAPAPAPSVPPADASDAAVPDATTEPTAEPRETEPRPPDPTEPRIR
jgi:monofunctional biosynthetic peptidoglycan transglycosylase